MSTRGRLADRSIPAEERRRRNATACMTDRTGKEAMLAAWKGRGHGRPGPHEVAVNVSYPDAARIAGTGLISMGAGLLTFVLITVVWGDPFTRLLASNDQGALRDQIARAEAQFGTDTSAPSAYGDPQPRVTRRGARRYRRSLAKGSAAGRITIPRLHLRRVIVNGAGHEPLKKGPGFYDQSAFPGTNLPVAIAGHRTTYGAPFLNIDRIRKGDHIIIDMPYGHFEYTVTRTRIITPKDWSILGIGAWRADDGKGPGGRVLSALACPKGNCEHLVLTACHPKYSAAQRYAVLARLTGVRVTAAVRRAA